MNPVLLKFKASFEKNFCVLHRIPSKDPPHGSKKLDKFLSNQNHGIQIDAKRQFPEPLLLTLAQFSLFGRIFINLNLTKKTL